MQIWKEGRLRIGIKNDQEIKSMRKAGKILGFILSEIEKNITEGMTGLELDTIAENIMKEQGVLPSFKGYNGFPNVACININQQVVHGIPSNIPFQTGDIVTFDCGVVVDGLHTDSAITKSVGTPSTEIEKFLKTAEKALEKAIQVAKPGIRIRNISEVIQQTVEKNGYSIVRDLIGHGIGTNLHEDPDVPNFVDPYEPGPILQPGMTIAIEPIISMGGSKIKLMPDKWTYETVDGSLATQVEHTILITKTGCEILTVRP